MLPACMRDYLILFRDPFESDARMCGVCYRSSGHVAGQKMSSDVSAVRSPRVVYALTGPIVNPTSQR